jgi:DNA-binding XRE family transcriptional regulator
MNQITELLKREEGPNPAARLAIKLGITESYVRMLDNDKATPGWRLAEAINELLNKEGENA